MIVAATIGSLVGAWCSTASPRGSAPTRLSTVPRPLRQVVPPHRRRRRPGRALVRPAGGRRRARRAVHPADPLAGVDPRRVPADAVRHVHAVHGDRLADLEHGADRRRLRPARQLGGRRAVPRRRAVRRRSRRSSSPSAGSCGPACGRRGRGSTSSRAELARASPVTRRRDLGVGALEVVAPALDPVVRHRRRRSSPSTARARRASRTGRVVPWTNRHGTAIAGRCSTRSGVGLAGRVQRIGDGQHTDDRRRRRLVVGAGGDHRAHPPAHRAPADDDPSPADRGELARGRRPSASAAGRAPAGPPCGTGSRRAPSPTRAPRPARRRRASTGPRRARRPGTAAACAAASAIRRPPAVGEDPARLGELEHGRAGEALVAAVVGVDAAHLRPELRRDLLLRRRRRARREAEHVQRPRPRVGERRQRRRVGAGEVGDQRRADRRRASASPCAARGR